MNKLISASLVILISGLLPASIAFADDVSNNLDASVDATLEVMNLVVGSDGPVTYKLHPKNGDGDSGCNLDSSSESVTFNVVTGNASVVTVAPTSVTFTGPGCGDQNLITVTAVGAGSTNITLSVASNNSGGTFNVATAAFTVNVAAPADVTPPVIAYTTTPDANGSGWNNSDVTVSWSVMDPESAITSTSGCDTTTVSDETAGLTLTCTATSAGGTSSESVTIKLDKTKPIITGARSPDANINGWNNTDVTANFSCAETGLVQSGIDTNTIAGATVSTEGAGQSVTNSGSCIDIAGNMADSATVSDINIDKTAPEIVITTPADGGSYTFKQTILADWNATDGLSGIDTAVGTVASGDSIDTSSLGLKSFTVTATDVAGNDANKTSGYAVVGYTFGGFTSPVNISAKDFKKMSTIPVKFQLFDTFSNPISNAIANLWVNGTPAVSSGGSNVGNLFRYDPVAKQYIFNLSTKMITLGSNTLHAVFDDGSWHDVVITIK